MPQVVIDMDGDDFDHLCESSMRWRGNSWREQAGRFEPHGKKYDEDPSWEWSVAYWVGDSFTTVLLARAFLQGLGETYEIVFDTAEHPSGACIGYVILTHYESKSWKEQKEKELERFKDKDQ